MLAAGAVTFIRRGWLLLVGSTAFAQSAAPPASDSASRASDPMTASAAWDSTAWLGSRAPIAFALSRPVAAAERVAILVGSTDVSGGTRLRGRRIDYAPSALRLPPGTSVAVAYLVSPDGSWQEVGRGTIRVRTRAGLDSGRTTPSVDLSSSGQLDQHVAAGSPPPDRKTYQDVTLRLGMQSLAARSGWEVSLRSNAVGASQRTQRLRWGERQDRAPTVDLADYQASLRRGGFRASVGNVSVGANRYLLSGFGSRGVAAGVQLNRALSIDAAAVNGTNVVGWDNPIGVTDDDHRMLATALNLELVPARPGALHVDLQGLDGSVLPRTGFTQGAVTDAERSRGLGVQVSMSDARQRIRFSGGVTQSRFRNPADPLLGGDTTIVAVREETRRARFGELGLQILSDRPITRGLRASLGATARHERVDPLFRSVGAFVQGDMQQDGGDLTASIGQLSIQGALSRQRDNLAGIPTILTTRTRRRALTVAAPVGALVGVKSAAWLPVASFAWEGTVQAGDGVPPNSDFAPTHVPSQFNRNRTASLTWTPSRLNLGYRWNESLQDNRQAGRERADLRTRVHAVSLGISGIPRVVPSLEGSVERQQLFETGLQQRTSRVGTTLQAQLTRTMALTSNVAHTWGWDPFATRRTRNLELQGELSQGFTLYRAADGGTQGRVFVRYARTRAAFFPLLPDATLVPQLMWTVNAGSSFRVF